MENLFHEWWDENNDGYVATPLMEKCFDGGFAVGYAEGVMATRILRSVLLGLCAVAIVFIIAG